MKTLSFAEVYRDLIKRLREEPSWFDADFGDSDAKILLYLDHLYSGQVIHEVATVLRRGQIDLDEAIDLALKRRGAMLKKVRMVQNLPTVHLYGTARCQKVSDSVKSFIEELAKQAVMRGWSCANGGSTTGTMGVANQAWRSEIERQRSKAKLIMVALKIEAAGVETPFDPEEYGVRFPPCESFPLRTVMLHFAGRSVLRVFLPGGLGTNEEIAVELLGRQMAEVVTTHHDRRRVMPPIALVSDLISCNGRREPYWNAFLRYIERQEQCGYSELHRIGAFEHIVLKDPIKAARNLVRQAAKALAANGNGT